MTAQGREALNALLDDRVSWPPVVIPFGLDPFGWHGQRESYGEVCAFALEHCTLLPKVIPFSSPLFLGEGEVRIAVNVGVEKDGTRVRRLELTGADCMLHMEETQTENDASWKVRKRWINSDEDLSLFLTLTGLTPEEPDIDAVRAKELQVGQHGLPYVEVADPFYTVCEMFPTELFYTKTRTDLPRITRLLDQTEERIIHGIERLCTGAGCPFILRLIGAEMAVPPFMGRDGFERFEDRFYKRVASIARQAGVPTAFHCHGPVLEIMDSVWNMGYAFIEPFEPPPRGNVSIAEALAISGRRGIVFGGIDDVTLMTGRPDEVRAAVASCLEDAMGSHAPYMLSQTATPFHDPLSDAARDNLILFMELGTRGAAFGA